jgi:hypothetical protein
LDIAPGHKLLRANVAEVAAIKDVLTSATGITSWTAWEGGEIVKNENGGTSRAPLPADQWRYFVIAFKGTNETITEIEPAILRCCTRTEDRLYPAAPGLSRKNHTDVDI